jgi:hypothetical protein
MPLVARAEAGADLYTEGTHFVFGDDGSRQVTQAEADILRRYKENGGVLKIEITESKKKGGDK